MSKKTEKLSNLTKSLIETIGEDPNREGLIKTPLRAAKAWSHFSQGYTSNLDEVINGAIFNEDCSDMVVVRDIEFFSMCEHHMIPFFGRAHVGYLPSRKVIGLSKIPRIVDMYARRLQVQERLTTQIYEELKSVLNTDSVMVLIEAKHLCVSSRGIKDCSSSTVTEIYGGDFNIYNKRDEFYKLLNSVAS